MPTQIWSQVLTASTTDGAALTAAATPASCIPGNNVITLPSYYIKLGTVFRITAMGRISCVVTTPGTARFQVRSGAAGATSIFDTGALNLNIVAKTTVPWRLDILLTCRTVGSGTSCAFMGGATFQSEAVVGAPLPTVGSNGVLFAPVGTPAVGSGIDSTVVNLLDLYFTQTVATGSLTCHQYVVESLT